jgi:hypothetical protein
MQFPALGTARDRQKLIARPLRYKSYVQAALNSRYQLVKQLLNDSLDERDHG